MMSSRGVVPPPEVDTQHTAGFYDSSGRPSLYSPAGRESNNYENNFIIRQVTKELIIDRRKSGLPINIPEPKAPPAEDECERDEETGEFKKKFIKSEGLSTLVAEELIKSFGRNELAEIKTPKWLIFLQQLYQPMPIMIWYVPPLNNRYMCCGRAPPGHGREMRVPHVLSMLLDHPSPREACPMPHNETLRSPCMHSRYLAPVVG